MIELLPDECRVLGVLIEKAQTTPEQYPLTLNAAVNGANQKSNRWPVLSLDEDRVLDALQGLRGHGLIVQVDQVGSRVHKYRHEPAPLNLNAREQAVLAELLLRGPQTLGELRGRASRMHPLESLEAVRGVLDGLIGRPEPLVRQVPPVPGSRAERYAQLLCPDLHPLDAVEPAEGVPAPAGASESIPQRVARLEAEVAQLRQALSHLARSVGEPDPLAAP